MAQEIRYTIWRGALAIRKIRLSDPICARSQGAPIAVSYCRWICGLENRPIIYARQINGLMLKFDGRDGTGLCGLDFRSPRWCDGKNDHKRTYSYRRDMDCTVPGLTPKRAAILRVFPKIIANCPGFWCQFDTLRGMFIRCDFLITTQRSI